ncbi:MAG: germination protein YpeB [Clostridia bacterium]|nr:germination protein YpeB [Clostridia bacterium]
MIKSRRGLIRIISFMSVVVAVLAVWGAVSSYKLSQAKISIQVSNERALTQLGTYLDDISLNLQKCMYCNGEGMLSDLSADLWRSSASAKESLSELTDGNTEISGVYKFLSQVGEYTISLNKRLAQGGNISDEETKNLTKLLEYSQKLSKNVNYLIEQEENGLVDFEEIKSTLQEDEGERLYLGQELNDANQSLQDYPTLIYDGPFSDHIMNKKSSVTDSMQKVTEVQAKDKAANFLEIKSSELYFLTKTQNNMSTYTFYNSDYTVSVTQNGGIVSSFMTNNFVSQIELSYEEAIKKGTEFLNKRGYDNIKESYYSTTDGICTINFSYYEDGITYYTDLIKVSVALDTGKITAFDATGYLMNYHKRTVPKKVKYTLSEGKGLINPTLEVLSFKKAFIPTDWESEEYVYEYRCRDNKDNEVLIYIDPVTGEEKDVLLLLYTDGGILTK